MGEDPALLQMIRKLDINDLEKSSLNEREKMILTTTGSIFKKMVVSETLDDDDLNRIESFNEDFLKSLIN